MTYWAEHAQQLKRELTAELSSEDLRGLHQKRPWLHALIAAANVAALILSGVAIVHFDRHGFVKVLQMGANGFAQPFRLAAARHTDSEMST